MQYILNIISILCQFTRRNRGEHRLGMSDDFESLWNYGESTYEAEPQVCYQKHARALVVVWKRAQNNETKETSDERL